MIGVRCRSPSSRAQLIAALWATINCCSASVTDRGGWCVAAPSNANRLAPLARTVNDQNHKNEAQQTGEAHVSGNNRTDVSASQDRPTDRSMSSLFRTERACEGHHAIAQRSSAHRHRQGPKAARSAGGAKRSALHGAEHRCSIVVVMADGVHGAQDVLTSQRPEVDIEFDAREAPHSRKAAGRNSRASATSLWSTLSGRTRPDRPEDLGRNQARLMR